MTEDLDALTLARYLSGELSPGEAARVRSWLDADPARQNEIARLRAVWDRPAAVEFDPDDAVWGRIAEQIDEPRTPALAANAAPANQGHTRSRMAARRTHGLQPVARLLARLSGWPVLAVAALVAVGSTLLTQWRERSDTHAAPHADREMVTLRAQTATIELSDGTRITLGPDSRLTIPAPRANDASTSRDVTLVGEGYFSVQHDPAHPFRVHTRLGVAEDVGTAFAVAAYPETRGMQVVVAEGVVSIHVGSVKPGDRPLATIARGTLAHLDSTGAVTLTHGVRVADYVAWTTGELVFDDTLLRDAIPALERTYDLDIRLGDPALGTRHLTAKFANDAPARALDLLALALDLRVEHRGTAVILYPLHYPLHTEHAS
jgi:ferric-dicitrate binding protein FerR (iron transport regulator)